MTVKAEKHTPTLFPAFIQISLDIYVYLCWFQAGMQQKLKEIQQSLSWIERLDVSVDPVARLDEGETDDDFKREMIL